MMSIGILVMAGQEIRNSTAEFLIFQIEGKEQGVEVYYKDKTVWCTQKAMGLLFDCTPDNVGLHLKNIFKSGELIKIHIEMDRNYITVSSDGGNGTLIIGDQQISIPTGQEIRINTK